MLTDGMGGLNFLKELTYQYLRLSHPKLREQEGDRLSADTSLNLEDSFLQNYKKCQKLPVREGLYYKSAKAAFTGIRRHAWIF